MGVWTMNTGGKTVDEIDNEKEQLPSGLYRAKCIKVELKQEDASVQFTFQVVHGPLSGRLHNHFLQCPAMANTDDQAKVRKQLASIYGVRLGVITREQEKAGDFDPDWSKAVGREVVFKIKERSWESADKKKSGVSHEIDFASIWPLDHKTVLAMKQDDRAAVGLAPATAPAQSSNGTSKNGSNGHGAAGAQAAAAQATKSADEMAKSLWG